MICIRSCHRRLVPRTEFPGLFPVPGALHQTCLSGSEMHSPCGQLVTSNAHVRSRSSYQLTCKSEMA
jgi:hypothetical protein